MSRIRLRKGWLDIHVIMARLLRARDLTHIVIRQSVKMCSFVRLDKRGFLHLGLGIDLYTLRGLLLAEKLRLLKPRAATVLLRFPRKS
jgi:hypothetical protein